MTGDRSSLARLPLRVAILGAAGEMGSHAARAAATIPQVGGLLLCDLDGERAAQLATELGPIATPCRLDVTDGVCLAAALSNVDAVLNAVGPFFRFGVPILRAAIEAGCHYVDICDDWAPTLEMLELDPAARAAGTTAIVGLGASPGIVNLLAVIAAAELDTVATVLTGWNFDLARPEASPRAGASAAIEHGIEQVTGTIRVLRDGRLVDEPPLRRIVVDYPGIGARPAHTFGHPEAVTLGGAIDGLGTSLNVTFGRRSTIAQAVALGWAIDHGLISRRLATRLANWSERHGRRDPTAELDAAAAGGLPPIFAHATGTHAGASATAAATLSALPGTTMGSATGVPLAIGLQLLCEGRVTNTGVLTPESAVEPDAFFAALAARCHGTEASTPIVAVTRSWDPDSAQVVGAAVIAAKTGLAEQLADRLLAP